MERPRLLTYRSAGRSLPADDGSHPFVTISGICIIIAIGSAAFLLIAKIVRDAPCNHWAFDIRYLWPIVMVTLPWIAFALRSQAASLRLTLVVCIAGAAFGLLLLLLDHFNLLVNYDVWIGRGMPDQWRVSR